MKKPREFYQNQIELLNQDLERLKKLLFTSSMLRLAVFFVIIIGIYLMFNNTKVVFAILIAGIIGFVYLVSRHSDLQYKRDLIKSLLAINTTELRVLDRNFHDLPNGDVYKNPGHHFSQDIDLFGRGSFFQYLNRTSLQSGADVLAKVLTDNSISEISQKQEGVKELSVHVEWRQKFSAIASLVKTEMPAAKVINWLNTYNSFVPKSMQKIPTIFSVGSILTITAYFLDFIPGFGLLTWFLIGLGITGRYFKKTNALSVNTARIQSTFRQFHKLLFEIEKQEFTTDLLSAKRGSIINSSRSASNILREFARHLDALDQRNNMLIGVLANGFMLRDLAQVYKIEKWIEAHREEVEVWFQTIAFFDAYNSLGNYAFNHPSQVYPIINENASVIKVTDAGHPLLDPKLNVTNDFQINNEQFFIITGANMAGKSTFLRTVALQIVMANIGLPVYASASEYTPIKLITSMRTTDSLTDDESYFFSELKRLKFIVDEIKDDRYFIILDEILKGTNSTDKAAGSRKFIDKLVDSKSTGIIATHDLSLCVAADDHQEVENYYFDARIENDELFFDYKIMHGICRNMNASFLLKKMKIVE